jgi:hypothetical protein
MAVQYAFGKIVTQGLDLNVDAADPTSYPGSGTSWTSVVNRSITGSLVSCSYSSDFKGGIVFNNPSASVLFPGTLANYGTGSFTVEMAFRPTQIQGIHYLVSKNSGSFPNWGVYLSGSGGAGKLFAEYRINASVSCSVSSSTTFVTGSNYQVDTFYMPGSRTIYISNNGNTDTSISIPFTASSLTTTASLFVGNTATSSSLSFSGSLFSTKVYSLESMQVSTQNFNTVYSRLSLQKQSRPSRMTVLVVAGGGAGISNSGTSYWEMTSGGGGGGVVYTVLPVSSSTYSVFVGAGATTGNTSGSNSVFGSATAFGGGSGGGYNFSQAFSGGSGAGGRGNSNRVGGTSVLNQGFPGGSGSQFSRSSGGGGGGGACAPGTDAGNNIGGNGGDGFLCSISGTPTFYGGGGGGAVAVEGTGTPGRGGRGGGGNAGGGYGTVVDGKGQNGIANTGGGGGGGDNSSTNSPGGSGIVIIRYPGSPIATGGTITSVGGDTIHTFTATGSSTFTVF